MGLTWSQEVACMRPSTCKLLHSTCSIVCCKSDCVKLLKCTALNGIQPQPYTIECNILKHYLYQILRIYEIDFLIYVKMIGAYVIKTKRALVVGRFVIQSLPTMSHAIWSKYSYNTFSMKVWTQCESIFEFMWKIRAHMIFVCSLNSNN